MTALNITTKKPPENDHWKKQYQQYVTNCQAQDPPTKEMSFESFKNWQSYVRMDVV